MYVYESYIRGRLIETWGQTVMQVQRLWIPTVAESNPLISQCLEVLNVHGNELRLFRAKAFPQLILCINVTTHVSEITAVGTTFNVFNELQYKGNRNLKKHITFTYF